MKRALKLNVHVGKDHIVKLPSEFPEGPAEVIIIALEQPVAAQRNGELSLWADVVDAEYDVFTDSVHRLRESDRLRSSDG